MDEFLIDKRLARRSFSRAAASYDEAAVLQREVARRMLERLRYVKVMPELILDAGSGTGYGRKLLRQQYRDACVIELDFALPMLQASARAPWLTRLAGCLRGARVMQVAGDVELLPLADSSVGLVWSNMTFQWCNDLDATFKEVRRVLQPGGLMLFSTFGPDTLKELRAAFGAVDGQTHVNRFIDMHDIGDALVRTGFGTPVMDVEHFTLTYPDLKALLRDLKALGAHNVTQGRPRGLFGRAMWCRLQDAYERFRRDTLLPATYEVVYGHAWKPEIQEQKSSSDQSVIRLDFPKRSRPSVHE